MFLQPKQKLYLTIFVSCFLLLHLPCKVYSNSTEDTKVTLTESTNTNSFITKAEIPIDYNSQYLVINLRFLKPEQVKSMLTTILPFGRVKFDIINNTLVAQGSIDDCAQLQALLTQIDVAPRQVMFEAQAYEISRDNQEKIGLDWGAVTVLPSQAPYDPSSTFRVRIGDRNHPEYGVNLQAKLNTLIENKRGRLLASPRIATLDGQTAKILIGDKLAVESTQINSGVTTYNVTYIDVGIKLEVTPTVNDDNTITAIIKPEVSNKTDTTNNGNPNIRTRQAETTVRVKNGETIVIGGLIQHQETKDVTKFPLLGDIPLIGHFFKTTYKEKIDNELVIMITPKIID